MKTEKYFKDYREYEHCRNKANVSRKDYCEMYPCEFATVEIIYGLYSEYQKGRPHYNVRLCDKAARELWDKCSGLVNLGWMHFTIKIIGNYVFDDTTIKLTALIIN